ncbi:MAG: FlgD immunoglobulin-like domain containing protein [Candidatus Krumholzibacteria bacterium]|jgi:hypothetical protein|nr:FlgD immunoglobulin-like domain containing protein [Candidatus Krumholzibacteria bacterium]MDP6669567.1 FlgD immunoglobulin-like domain containing protein [Candidatus Krumholzibacteria bacterium]MDP6796535.1 FlgD immunoglobulin-like domain containing protein [Candidatus Krumholzibacteria bacterium]MDP7021744.1 FlgD immunoglobulin-like domain containing protein [Candidatus Krumholzibacteria bacterium]
MKYLITFLLALTLCLPAMAQDTYTVYEIQQGSVPEDSFVRVDGLVVTAVAPYGFFAQEVAAGAFSGIWVYTGSGDPPVCVIGDLVNVVGEYYEYYSYTEIDVRNPTPSGFAGFYEMAGTDDVPVPEPVRAWQVRTSNPDEAELWECVLVQLENLEPLDLDPGYGEWFAEEFNFSVNDTARFDDMFDYGQPLPGQTMESAAGPVRFSYDEFKVEPRANYDLIFSGAEPAPNLEYAVVTGTATIDVLFDRVLDQATAENPWNYFMDSGMVQTAVLDANESTVHLTLYADMATELYLNLTVFDVQNQNGVPMIPQDVNFWGGINTVAFANTPDVDGDLSICDGTVITLTGVVQSKYYSHVYLQDVAGGPYSGIEVYCPPIIDDLSVGDILIIGDYLTEYYGQTSVTYPFYYYEFVSSGNTPPDVVEMGITGVNFEEFEGRLVQVLNAEVCERPNYGNYYDWSISQDFADSLWVTDTSSYDYMVGVGDIVDVTGTLRYEFGFHKMRPRDDNDINVIYSNPNDAPGTSADRLSLKQNFPNPFNPTTEISFRLEKGGEVLLEVFDLEGRLVRTLMSGPMEQGDHQVTWQGIQENGDAASSGVYLYRLTTEEGSQHRKMTLLK